MGMRLIGLFAIVPISVLLTISFFVLFAVRKVEIHGLKAFGYVVSALLWMAALLLFSGGIYMLSTGHHPMSGMMKEMMGSSKCEMRKHEMMEREMAEHEMAEHKMMEPKMPESMKGPCPMMMKKEEKK
ncbi:MAG: hypothetical protein HQL24_05925 [Candidatus Omnitrophica bacterium]|nr:hypothetical protein [Candidatus Omnitrophota bacterium]